MEWLEVHIDTNHAGLEPLEIFLSANGVDGVVIDDEQDFQSFLENNHQYWDYVDEDLEASMKGKSRITFYLPADGDGFDQLAHLRTALQGFKGAHAGKYGTLLMTLENLKDADWENNWKQYYKPMEIGERLLVIPEWEQENVKGQAKYAGKVPLILEPGLTFGTGSHATTRLCLTALEEAVHGGETVLDLGCGSGILSIAALRLGAASADDGEKAMELALIENLQREDLKPLEEANGYKMLMDNFEFTQEEIAKTVCKSRPAITNALRLLNLPEDMQNMLERGEMTAGHARTLLSFKNEDQMKAAARRVTMEGISVRELEKMAKRANEEKPEKADKPAKCRIRYYDEAELALRDVLNRVVHISGTKKKAALIIEFYGEEDLKNLLYDLKLTDKTGE